MSRNLRVGLIGLGSMGRNHARVLASLPGVDFIAIAEPAENSERFSQGRPVVKNTTDLIKLGLDYAIVAVPTIFHLEVCAELAKAGVHVMVEKPISHDFVTSKQLAKMFTEVGLVGAVGHIERYNPALQEARHRLEQLGSIYQVVTRRQGPFPSRVVDVGVIKDLATHDIDLTSWITNERYTSVSSRTTSGKERKCEDLVAVVGSLESGTVTNHLVNWLSPLKERVTVITGEKGAFVADTLTGDLTFYANGTVNSSWDEVAQFRGVSEGDIIRYAIPKHEPLRIEHENFRDAILGKRAEIVSMEQAVITILVAEAIIESAQKNQTINLLYRELAN